MTKQEIIDQLIDVAQFLAAGIALLISLHSPAVMFFSGAQPGSYTAMGIALLLLTGTSVLIIREKDTEQVKNLELGLNFAFIALAAGHFPSDVRSVPLLLLVLLNGRQIILSILNWLDNPGAKISFKLPKLPKLPKFPKLPDWRNIFLPKPTFANFNVLQFIRTKIKLGKSVEATSANEPNPINAKA